MTPEQYDNLPDNVKAIVDSFDDDQDPYRECERIVQELNEVGYEADYGLCGGITYLAPKKSKLN